MKNLSILWKWNYSGTGISAVGTFTTNDTPNNSGFYQISEISGTRNNEKITALQPAHTSIPGNEPYTVDNLISLKSPQLTNEGFGYSTSGGKNSSPFYAADFCDKPGYFEFSSPPEDELPVNFVATIITDPEPSSRFSLLGLSTLSTLSASSVLKRKQSN